MNAELERKIREWVGSSHGWMTPERALELASLITSYKPQTCVEIGVFGGRSLISEGLALKDNGEGVIYGIDPWKTSECLEFENEANRQWWSAINLHDIHKSAAEGIWRYGLERHVVLVRAPSQHCYKMFGTIDFLFIDGNHSEAASCRDVDLYLPKLAVGGYMVMDDTDWPTTARAQEIITASCEVIKDGLTYKIFKKR